MHSCKIVTPYYLDRTKEEQEGLKLESLDLSNQFNNEVLSINSENFHTVLENDTLSYKILAFVTFWCPNSEKYLPIFIQQTDSLHVRIFYISPDDWVYKNEYISFISKFNIKSNVYLLDVYKYGEKRNPHYRMHKFISQVCDKCGEIKGFPSFIILNNKNEIIYKNFGPIPVDIISELKIKTQNAGY